MALLFVLCVAAAVGQEVEPDVTRALSVQCIQSMCI